MFLLGIAVIANLLLAVCFKLYARTGVDPFTAIVINYWTSVVIGCAIAGHIPLLSYDPALVPWATYGIALGCLFVIGFTVIAFSIRYAGIAITTAMQKMSLMISVSYAVIFFGEPFGLLKITGVILAIVGIWMVTHSDIKSVPWRQRIRILILPLGTLLFNGVIESVLYHVHAHHLAIHGDIVFTTYAFSIAACVGTIVVLYRHVAGKHRMTMRDVIGGLALGIPNFFTIYLILVLLHNGFAGSVLYPVLNILVLAFSAIIGLYLFREKLSKVNIAGITIALIAILLISLAD